MKDSPTDSVNTPRVEVDWYRSTPWWRLISRTISISIRSTHLLLCALGMLLMSFGAYIGDATFGKMETPLMLVPLVNMMGSPETGNVARETVGQIVQPVFQFASADSLSEFAHSLFRLFWNVVVWAMIGGVLLRRSVVELGTQSGCGWAGAFRLVKNRFLAFVWSIGTPLLACLGLALFPLLLGLIARAGVPGQTIAAVLSTPAALVMIGVGWLAVIGLFGFSLSWTAIVAEKNADAFDGFSRSSAYLLQRPFTIFLCGFLGVVAFSVAYTLVWTATDFAERVLVGSMSLGAGQSINELMAEGSMRGMLYGHSVGLLNSLPVALGASFFWSASAATYLVVRREVDHTDFDDLELNEYVPPTEGPTVEAPEPATSTEQPASSEE